MEAFGFGDRRKGSNLVISDFDGDTIGHFRTVNHNHPVTQAILQSKHEQAEALVGDYDGDTVQFAGDYDGDVVNSFDGDYDGDVCDFAGDYDGDTVPELG